MHLGALLTAVTTLAKASCPLRSKSKSSTGRRGVGSAAPGAVMGAATLTIRSTFAPHLGQNFATR